MTEIATKRCFGISWSATDPKCAGGPDPMYVDDETGSHDRPKCDFFNVCGARKMAVQQEQRMVQIRLQQQQVPMQQPMQVQQAQVQQPVQQVPLQVQQQMMQRQMMPQMPMMPPQMLLSQMMPQQMMVQAPMQLPVQQVMPVNFFMPGYLSVPEAQTVPGFGGYMGMLGLSIVRAMFKAAGHTIANVLDTNPFGVPQQK